MPCQSSSTSDASQNCGPIAVPTVLTLNGLTVPDDFPASAFERVWKKISPLSTTRNALYVEFSSAWNALTHRYLAMVDHGEGFTASVIADGTSPKPERRHYQEQCLFDFFSSGFSAFDAFFYATFAVGALVDAVAFPLTTEAEQKSVSSGHTLKCYRGRFSGSAILAALEALAGSAEYRQWRDVRNILTHRAAPGRTLHVSGEPDDETPVDRWKVFGIPLDRNTIPERRAHASGLLTPSVTAVADFVELHL